MTDPYVELQRARIRYLSAFARGEIVQSELNQRLAMIERTEARLAKLDEQRAKAREAVRSWKTNQKLKAAFHRSLEASDGL